MKTVKLEFDQETLERVQRLAEALHTTLENAIAQAVERFEAERRDDPVLGVFADAPEVMDQVVDASLEARARDPLRTKCG